MTHVSLGAKPQGTRGAANLWNVSVYGVGARTPFGLTPLQVTMSVRADRFAPRESHLIDRHGEPIAMPRLASIGDHIMGLPRFVGLGGSPITQAAHPYLSALSKTGGAAAPIPLFVALPYETRPGFDRRMKTMLFDALSFRSRVALDVGRSRMFHACRGGGVLAIEAAASAIASGELQAVLVGGVDSYFDPDVLGHLDEECRLHGMGTENGFIPGEGAAFLLLASRAWARENGNLLPLSRIVSTANELEPHPYGSTEPNLAQGLTAAVRQALSAASAPPRRISWLLTDVANERHRVDEWQFARVRNDEAMTAEAVHDQPLLRVGDVGSASAALLCALAITRWETGCAVGSEALVVVSSDGPERGALVLGDER